MRGKATILVLLALLIISTATAKAGEVLFQYSTIKALLVGFYEGHLTTGELKKHGNLGLGTFNSLDGEMVVLDGQVYQVKADGKVYVAPDMVKTPFASVTFFSPKQTFPLKKVATLKELSRILDEALPSRNLFYAVKMEGRFSWVKARSVPRQTRPFPPLAQAVEQQAVFRFTEVEGTMLGFRCPAFVKGVNVPEWHLHFLTKDRTAGGHVLDCSLENLTAQIDPIHKLTLILPEDREFYRLNLDQDKARELQKVER